MVAELDSYVIRALGTAEVKTIEAHLARCASCASEALKIGEESALPAVAAPMRRHSDALRERILREMRASDDATGGVRGITNAGQTQSAEQGARG